jgi:hypothetical protein
VWTILSITLLTFIGPDFVATLPRGGLQAASPEVRWYFVMSNVAAAVWAVWLYAALRAGFGPGMRTAAIAGIAWWFVQSLQAGKFAAMSGTPVGTWLPLLAATLVAMVASVACGAWLYEYFMLRHA